MVYAKNLILGFLFASFTASLALATGWEVDCNNHCFFSEFQNNCQGVYYRYPDGTKSYSGWSDTYNACQETSFDQLNTHIITQNLINCSCPTPTATPPADRSAPMTQATREKLELLRAQIQGWTVCSPDPAKTFPTVFKPISYRDLEVCQVWRKNGIRRNYIATNGCYFGLHPWGDSQWRSCDYMGDQAANTVAACISGNVDRCNDLFRCTKSGDGSLVS